VSSIAFSSNSSPQFLFHVPRNPSLMIFSSAMRGCVPESEGKADVPSAPEGWTNHFKAENILDSGFLRLALRRWVPDVSKVIIAKTGYVGWTADQCQPIGRWRRCLGVLIGKALNHSQCRRSCSGRFRVFGGIWLRGLVSDYLIYVVICYLKMEAIGSSKLYYVLSYNATVSL